MRRAQSKPLFVCACSSLPFPCTFRRYCTEALGKGFVRLPPHLTRLYRVVPAASFLRHFASNRSHMWSAQTGGWQEPPPTYPCITAADGSTHTLPCYLEMPLQQGSLGAEDAAELLGRHRGGRSGLEIEPLPPIATAAEEVESPRYGAVLTEEAFMELFRA